MRLRLGLAALAATSLIAVPALAADHTATLSASAPTFSWDGAAATSFSDPIGIGIPGCGDDGHKCEDVLLNIEAPGDLTITLESAEGAEIPDPSGVVCENGACGSVQDFDATFFAANAAGEPQGDAINEDCATTYASEACEVLDRAAGAVLADHAARIRDLGALSALERDRQVARGLDVEQDVLALVTVVAAARDADADGVAEAGRGGAVQLKVGADAESVAVWFGRRAGTAISEVAASAARPSRSRMKRGTLAGPENCARMLPGVTALTDAQRSAVDYPGRPLLRRGGRREGGDRGLVERFCWLRRSSR